jgi:hypothetical protein
MFGATEESEFYPNLAYSYKNPDRPNQTLNTDNPHPHRAPWFPNPKTAANHRPRYSQAAKNQYAGYPRPDTLNKDAPNNSPLEC